MPLAAESCGAWRMKRFLFELTLGIPVRATLSLSSKE
jgi:hypothetical protein